MVNLVARHRGWLNGRSPRRPRARRNWLATLEGLEPRTVPSLTFDFASWFSPPQASSNDPALVPVVTSNGSAIDQSGNVYITGGFRGNGIDFHPNGSLPGGGDVLSSPFDLDLYVAKYSPAGDLLWVTRQSGASLQDDEGFGLAIDPLSSDLLVTGRLTTARFLSNVYIDRLDTATGRSRQGWGIGATVFGGDGLDEGRAITVDSTQDGLIYVTGRFSSDFYFGPDRLATGTNDTNILVLVLGRDGRPLRAYQRGTDNADPDIGLALTPDNLGGVYIAGQVGPAGNGSIYLDHLVDLITSGRSAPAWGGDRTTFGDADSQANGIAVDSRGNVYAAGYFHDSVDFGSGKELTSTGGSDGFAVTLNSSAIPLFAGRIGGEGSDAVTSMAREAGTGNLILAGWFSASSPQADLDPGTGAYPGINLGQRDVFVAEVLDNLNLVQATTAGGKGDDRPTGVSVNANRKIGLTGAYSGSAPQFGSFVLPVIGPGVHAFVAGLTATSGTTPTPTPPTPTPPPGPARRPRHRLPRPAPFPPLKLPPTVVAVHPQSQGGRLTGITIKYSQPMDVRSVQDPYNYQLNLVSVTGPDPSIPLNLPLYGAWSRTVTIGLTHPARFSEPLRLTINAAEPDGAANERGVFLDGDGNGTPGGDSVTILGASSTASRRRSSPSGRASTVGRR